VSLICAACGGAPAKRGSSAMRWPVPAGWRAEHFALPTDFAPSLGRRGFEELRFAPGFSDASAPGFWSYAFVWWLDDDRPVDAASLAADLITYFDGLASAVDQQSHKLPATRTPSTATLGSDLRGDLVIWDAFTSGAQITLRARITPRQCGSRHAVVFELSPADPAAPIWRDLDALSDAVDCPVRGVAPPVRPSPFHTPL
jgi:hypothetical protein